MIRRKINKILWKIHMYFEEKRNWEAKMSVPLTITIISEPSDK